MTMKTNGTFHRWEADLPSSVLGPLCRVNVASLLVELFRHRVENHARPFADLAVGEIAAMLGVLPKLLWRTVHFNQTHIG